MSLRYASHHHIKIIFDDSFLGMLAVCSVLKLQKVTLSQSRADIWGSGDIAPPLLTR
jgi:hypothetical protein